MGKIQGFISAIRHFIVALTRCAVFASRCHHSSHFHQTYFFLFHFAFFPPLSWNVSAGLFVDFHRSFWNGSGPGPSQTPSSPEPCVRSTSQEKTCPHVCLHVWSRLCCQLLAHTVTAQCFSFGTRALSNSDRRAKHGILFQMKRKWSERKINVRTTNDKHMIIFLRTPRHIYIFLSCGHIIKWHHKGHISRNVSYCALS